MHVRSAIHGCMLYCNMQRINLFQSNLTWRTLYINKLAMMPPAHQQRCSLLSVVIFASTVDVIALLPLRCIIGLMEQADFDAPNQDRDAASTPLYNTMQKQQRLLPADDMLLSPCSLPTRAPSGLFKGKVSAIKAEAPLGATDNVAQFSIGGLPTIIYRALHTLAPGSPPSHAVTCKTRQKRPAFPAFFLATGALLQSINTTAGEEWAGAPPCPHHILVCQYGML